jgi:ElaB/YqjD/DUF883 family membrane-anchored ribosome-binding protein
MQGTTTTGNGGNGSGIAARENAAQVGEKAHAGLDRLTQSAHSTIDRVTAAASSAADRLTDGQLAHTAQEWRAQTTTYVREHPMTAIGIALAAGYVLSRLMSSR